MAAKVVFFLVYILLLVMGAAWGRARFRVPRKEQRPCGLQAEPQGTAFFLVFYYTLSAFRLQRPRQSLTKNSPIRPA